MKKILTAAVMLAAASGAAAQDWGIRAAFDINLPGRLGGRLEGAEPLDWYKSGFGGSFGVVYDHWLSGSVFLQPGISLFYDSYAYKDLIISGESGSASGIEIDPSLYKVGARIPVVVGYSYDLLSVPMRVYTGPEASYAFGGDIRLKNRTADLADLHLFGEHGEQNRFNAFWKIGLAAEFDFAIIGVDVAIGLTDTYKGPLKARENRVEISLAHLF